MNYRITRLLVLGIISITGIFGIQNYLLSKNYSAQQRIFNQKVHIALYEVVKRTHNYNQAQFPANNPVKKISTNYYIVNVEKDIDCEVLEVFLKKEFEKQGLKTDFEYAVYNCHTDEMVHGNYISYKNPSYVPGNMPLPKYNGLTYYFGIRFPRQHWFIAGNMWLWAVFTVISLTALVFFIYAMAVVLQQKRFSELQTDVVNNMTHQFKTPLATSKLALEYFSGNAIIQANERLAKYCDTLQGQNERLIQYVDQILTFARSEKKTMPLSKASFDLEKAITDELLLFKNNHPGATFNFKNTIKNITLEADKFHFTNALHNLIDNGIKYNNSKPILNINIQQRAKYIYLTVSDNGIGIDKKHLGKIFKRFFRVSTGNVHNVKGFGLGLFYVKQVCALHGWKIKVQSKPGHGTVVSILIKQN